MYRQIESNGLVAICSLFIIALTASTCLMGCATETKQIQEYLDRGDKLILTLEAKTREFELKIQTATRDFVDPSGITSAIDDLKASANTILSEVNKAAGQYKKVLSSKVTHQYANSANARLEELSTVEHLLTEVTSDDKTLASYSSVQLREWLLGTAGRIKAKPIIFCTFPQPMPPL